MPTALKIQPTSPSLPTLIFSTTTTPARGTATNETEVLPKPDCTGMSAKPFGVTPSPNDPVLGGYAAEGIAIAFTERIQRATVIVLIEGRKFLPARWNTSDGARPDNPHRANSTYTIITPERARVVTVAKGEYTLPEIYLAHDGGKVGSDCYFTSNSLSLPNGPIGTRFLYLIAPYSLMSVTPVVNDPRYQFYRASRIYPVSPDGTITIGPESDIMGNRHDDPPRILTVSAVITEIATLNTMPATPTTR